MKISIGKKILTGFATALLALLATSIVSYQSTAALLDTNHLVEHTYMVTNEIKATLLTVTSAESGVRGYVFTGETSYLDPYTSATYELDQDIAHLKEMTADDPQQQATIPLLQQHMNSRMSLLKGLINTRRQEGFSAAQAKISSGAGKVEMAAIEDVIGKMTAEENGLLTVRTAKAEESASAEVSTTFLLGILDFIFLSLLYVLTNRDLSKRRAVEKALEQERHLLHTLMDYLPDSIYFKDRKSRFIRINQALTTRLGLNDPAEAEGKTDFDFFSLEHAQPAHRDELAILQTSEPLFGKEERETWDDGRVRWVRTTKMPLFDSKRQIIGTFGMSSDVTERKRLEGLLQELAIRDELTGLYNRREMGRILDVEIDRFKRYGHPTSLVLLDIDHFKNVNDLYGHQVGDAVLKWAAQVIESSVRQLDYATRFGGEEFAIILPETSEANAIVIADRLLRCISTEPFRTVLEDKVAVEIHLTASLGVAEISGTMGDDIAYEVTRDSLIARADNALYRAKHRGRNQVVYAGTMSDYTLVAR